MIAAGLVLWFTIIYGVLGALIIGVELYGVVKKRRGDTISEHYWWVQKRAPWVRIFLLGFLIWLAVHLAVPELGW